MHWFPNYFSKATVGFFSHCDHRVSEGNKKSMLINQTALVLIQLSLLGTPTHPPRFDCDREVLLCEVLTWAPLLPMKQARLGKEHLLMQALLGDRRKIQETFSLVHPDPQKQTSHP